MPPDSVGRTECFQNCARDGKRQASLDAGEGNFRAEPTGCIALRLFRPRLDLVRRMLRRPHAPPAAAALRLRFLASIRAIRSLSVPACLARSAARCCWEPSADSGRDTRILARVDQRRQARLLARKRGDGLGEPFALLGDQRARVAERSSMS